MQNKAARLVTHMGMRTSRQTIFTQVGWLTVNQLSFYHSALSTYRIRQNQEPEYLSNIMNRNNRANRIIIPNTDLTLAQQSYCFRGSAQWNSLPGYLRNTWKISTFKSQLKKWIQQNVPKFVDSWENCYIWVTGPRLSSGATSLLQFIVITRSPVKKLFITYW